MPKDKKTEKNKVKKPIKQLRVKDDTTIKPLKKAQKTAYTPPSEMNLQIIPWIIGIFAVFFLICMFLPASSGWLGKSFKNVFGSLFSYGAYLIPFLLVARAISYRNEAQKRYPGVNWWLSFAFLCIFACLLASIISDGNAEFSFKEVFTMKHYREAFNDEGRLTAHSLIGGFFSSILTPTIGKPFTIIVCVIALLIISPFLVSKTPADMARGLFELLEWFTAGATEQQEKKEEEKLSSKKRQKPEFDEEIGEKNPPLEDEKPEQVSIDDPVDDTPEYTEPEDPERLEMRETLKKILGVEDTEKTEVTVTGDEYADGGMSAEAEIVKAGDSEEENEMLEQEKTELDTSDGYLDEEYTEEYQFPPVEILKQGEGVSSALTQEYETTAKKLVETLASFKVNAKIVNIAKGPTVTRYELQPEVGVRVRAIRNLSEDIALSLASKGVRIEAPIPGKEAVGIEVPNRNKSTVTIRELIESKAFQDSKSRLTSCLGVDVAGNPVYCDIAKMPHLLIAGTTGSGKSVCINSFLVSMLYKATPEEVKFILIDPKKIELGVYNGIPHLLVPVVSDPKKAAGALAWAVGEMERRFALIEEVGVRDIIAYNEVAKVETEREMLPRIVIVIDELADLMMMARDNVESSICRIAQKARAAGMHLIIGTQRPSVDVITGLIKANVPSRIAFTVASQVDSKTILDMAGAEKLVGRGDMLYAPIGAMTPTRVQGSFVSDKEIEEIIDFLKGNSTSTYSDEVIEGIEREAERCNDKGKAKLGGDDEDGDDGELSLSSDPMLKPAIEIALDSGSISTSMLQRRLKLGYARAARIIDMMYEMGIVSEFAGSKPRVVLISREKYIEMLTSSEE